MSEATKQTRQEKAWSLAEQIYWAVEHGEKLRAEQLLDEWANEKSRIAAVLDQALNEGDGSYRP